VSDYQELGRLARTPFEPVAWGRVPLGAFLALLGLALALLDVLTFSQFLRALFLRAHQEQKGRRVEAFFLAVGAVIGGSFGLIFAPPVVRTSLLALGGLAAAWMLVVFWHLRLVLTACGYAQLALSAHEKDSPGTIHRVDGKGAGKPHSGNWKPVRIRIG